MAWVNPEQTAPPVAFFDNFPGFGTFSIQWTATDQFAWSGIPGTVKCRQEGLCHPQYVFYRENWNIVVNTWSTYISQPPYLFFLRPPAVSIQTNDYLDEQWPPKPMR